LQSQNPGPEWAEYHIPLQAVPDEEERTGRKQSSIKAGSRYARDLLLQAIEAICGKTGEQMTAHSAFSNPGSQLNPVKRARPQKD
jgi:hypothetical protein